MNPRLNCMQAVITLLLFLAMGGLVFCLFFFEIKPQTETILNILIGSITTAFTTAVSYWIGSSRGSAEKQQAQNEFIASAIKKDTPP